MPVNSVMSLMGLALSRFVSAAYVIHSSGVKQASKTTGLRIHQRVNLGIYRLIELTKIHARVHLGNLVGVSVEHQGRPLEEFADPPFPGLAPSRMVHVRI